MISDYSYIMNVDVAQGEMVYDTKSNSVMIYDGQTWKFISRDEDKFEKRKRIISKLLTEN
jgi:hypothetical protein